MRLLKDKYLVENTEELIESTNQLLLFEDRDIQEIWKLRVVQIPEGERDVRVGDILRANKSTLVPDLDDTQYFVKKQDIINIL